MIGFCWSGVPLPQELLYLDIQFFASTSRRLPGPNRRQAGKLSNRFYEYLCLNNRIDMGAEEVLSTPINPGFCSSLNVLIQIIVDI
jgi:hypothetical protein